MLIHAGNSYVNRQIRLRHTGYGYKYRPLGYLFCILIKSDSRSNYTVAKESKQRSRILKGIKKNLRAMCSIFINFVFN